MRPRAPADGRAARTLVALAVLTAAIGACSAEGRGGSGPTTTDPPPRVEVEVVPAGGARLSTWASERPVLVLGDALVALGDGAVAPGRADPLLRSTDGGRTWTVPRTPEADPGDLSTWDLHAVDGLGILTGGWSDSLAPPQPVLWISDDDGATFRAVTGLTEGTAGAVIHQVVAVRNDLVALGDAQFHGSEGQLPAAWTSTDRGRTWSQPVRRSPVGSIPDAAVVDGLVLAGGGSGFVRSSDSGRTWAPLDVPVPAGHGVGRMLSSAGVVVVTTNTTTDDNDAGTLVSTDAGATWHRSAPLPSVPDLDSGTTLNPLDHLLRLPDGDLVATTTTTGDGRNLAYVLRSTDGGRSWTVADLGQDCPSLDGGEGSSRLSLAAAGSLVATVYRCTSLSPRLLASTDGGRTWTEVRHPGVQAIQVGRPFTSGDGRVSVLGGDGTHRAMVHLTVSPSR